jgi:hypothetical protein
MVRAAGLKQTPSGSYYNQSTGVTDSAFFIVGQCEIAAAGSDFRMFPNPTRGAFTVLFTGEAPQEFSLRILDLAGREVMGIPYQNSKEQHSFTIDPGMLATGSYLVSMEAGGTRTVKKLEVIF